MIDSILRMAAVIRAPAKNTTGGTHAVSSTTVTVAASSSAVDTGVTADGNEGQFITLVASEDAHIAFGASTMSAATTSDWPLTADIPQTFHIIPSDDRYFRAIAASSAASTIFWYRSSS